MDARGNPDDIDDEATLAIRAAWLYHADGMTQGEVARLLGVAPAKAHRLVARAMRSGAVRVFVEGPIAGCLQQERALAARFGLGFCRVVPTLPPEALPLRALGIAAAGVLANLIEAGTHRLIGVGHGRTLAAAVDHLPRIEAGGIGFVSLLGGLPRRTPANPFDVIHRLAEKTGAEAHLVPVPFFANSEPDRAVLLRQRGVTEAFAIAERASLFVVGIGEVAGEALLPAAGMVSAEEAAALQEAGAVGEVLGQYLDAGGQLVATPLHQRVIALPLAAMRGREVIGVAGGSAKIAAIRSVLLSGVLSGLITDELTARRLLEAQEPRETSARREKWTGKPGSSAAISLPAASDGAN